MKIKIHPSYVPALLIGFSMQAAWLAFFFFCTFHILPFALIPAAAYLIFTPIIILRHPQPTTGDLQMVRSGYFFYCIIAILIAWAYRAFSH